MNKKHTTPVVVGMGEILWDILPGGRRLGGAPANFAFHAHHLGANAAIVSAVGCDPAGADILIALDQLRLNRNYVTTEPQHPTGEVGVSLSAEGLPSYRIQQDVAWDYIPFSSSMGELAGMADVVCFGSLAQRSAVSRGTIRKFLEATRSQCLRLFDVNLRELHYRRQTLEESLQIANTVKLNDEELLILSDALKLTGSVPDQLRQLLRRYELELIALTRGENGAILLTESDVSECSGIAAVVADTVGAGDAFTAALAMGVLQNERLDLINQRACQLAAFVCSQRGAMPATTSEFVAKLYHGKGEKIHA